MQELKWMHKPLFLQCHSRIFKCFLSTRAIWRSNELIVLEAFHSSDDGPSNQNELTYSTSDVITWKADWFDPLATGIRSYRTSSVNPNLKNLNSTRRLYLAAHIGHMPLFEVHCKAPIKKNKASFLTHALANKLTDGYPAYSLFNPLFHTECDKLPVTISEILDLTGVPFQTRLHSIALGYPILGDPHSLHPSYKMYLFDRIHQAADTNLSLHLHCWKAQFLIEKQGSLIKYDVCSPDQLSPLLGLAPRIENSSDTILMNASANAIDDEPRYLRHKGFFHYVDPTNLEIIYQKIISAPSGKNHNLKDTQIVSISNQNEKKTIDPFADIQKSYINSEARLNFPQRVHQKFHDHHTPFELFDVQELRK